MVYKSISLCYNTWNDNKFFTNELFQEIQNVNQYSAQYNILEKLQSEHFMVRTHIFRPKQYILLYWFKQIAKSLGTDLQHLGFDAETDSFKVLPMSIGSLNDQEISEVIIHRERIVLSSQHINMNQKTIHFAAAFLSVCMVEFRRFLLLIISGYFKVCSSVFPKL